MTTQTTNDTRPFIKYPSLINSYAFDAAFLGKLGKAKHSTFSATEKLHGSNFSLHYDGGSVLAARRNALLEDGEGYFSGWEQVFERVSEEVLIWDLALNQGLFTNEPVKSVHVYGELFGATVFPEMAYATRMGELDWRVFSVLLTLKDGRVFVVGLEKLKAVFGTDALVPVVAEGSSLTELLEGLDITAPSRLGGQSEGYVLMPTADRFWVPGEPFFGIKHKTPGFSEVPTANALANLRSLNAKADLAGYFTVARLESVISKGDVALKRENIGQLAELLIDDAFADYTGVLTADELTNSRRALKGVAGKLIAETLRARNS